MSYRSKVYLYVAGLTEANKSSFLEELHFEGSVLEKKTRDGGFYLALGENTEYEPYISDMIRVCLGSLLKRPKEIKALKEKYGLTLFLTMVPHLVDEERPQQCLSLDQDIIEWLYLSDVAMDLDYYLA